MKDYDTYNGLWKHNKKYHSKNTSSDKPNDKPDKPNDKPDDKPDIKTYKCPKCENVFVHYQSRWKHQRNCNNIIKKDVEEKDKEMQLIKSKLYKLEKKVNKKVINNNNGNIYNGNVVNNNITINKIGSENLLDFNDNEITMIFNKELEGIITFIELLNFNERLPQNHSYCTTSLESKYLSKYNEETKTIEKDRKKYFFDKLLNTTIDRIQILYNSNKKKFTKIKQKQIEENITNLKTLKNYDYNNKILKEMINKMNLVSYNKRKIIQKTWNEDSDSDDDFQKDLEKETKEEFYKKIEMKKQLAEKLELEYEKKSETISSEKIIKKSAKKFILKKQLSSSSSSMENSESEEDISADYKEIFIDVYKNNA
jgi:hypothetical protein